jgi:hypothetical protein
MEATNMPGMTQTVILQAKGTIRALKLNRETLRELDAGGIGPGATHKCITLQCTRKCDSYAHCTRGCGER